MIFWCRWTNSFIFWHSSKRLFFLLTTNMSTNTSTSTDSQTSSGVINRVKFSVFLSLQIPSILCSLYLFAQYAIRANLRRSIHYHILVVLLCSSLVFVMIPVSASEAFFYTSTVRPASNLFCSMWIWIHYSINIGNLMLMAFACAERHWLLFRLNALETRQKRMFYHYMPMAICLLYPVLFYFVLIFLYPCTAMYDFNQLLCLLPCYFKNRLLTSTDTFLNNWAPIVAIPLLSSTVFVRFLSQKRRMQMEIFQWKRDRKMVIQLLSIVALYICMWGPVKAMTIFNLVWNVPKPFQFQVDYLYSFPYFIHLLYPFVILLSNPELRRRSHVRVPIVAPIQGIDRVHTT